MTSVENISAGLFEEHHAKTQELAFHRAVNMVNDDRTILTRYTDQRWKLIISAAPLSDRVYQLSVAAAALELR